MTVKKVLLLGAIAGTYYYLNEVQPRVDVSGAEVGTGEAQELGQSQEPMPFWQNILIGAAASLGFDALGAAVKKAFPPKAKPGAVAAVGDAATAAEKVGATAAADATKAGVAAEKAAATAAADAAAAADRVITTEVVKSIDEAAKAAEDAAKAARAAEKTALTAADDAAKAGIKSIQLAEDAAKATAMAVKASRASVAAAKVSTMLAKATAMGPLGVIDLLVAGIVMTLQMTVKNFDAEAYEPIPPGYIGYSQLPEAVRIIIAQIPILGSLLDLVGPLFQFGENCPAGTHQESPGGLCFPDCPAGYKSDGAFICYKQYDGFDQNGGNGMIHTLTSITKNTLVDTGTVPDTCGPDDDKEGGICYPKCREGFHGVGPLCWRDTVNVGAGTPVEPEPCPSGWNADSLVTCSNPIQTSLDPCPPETWDVAGTCWGKKNLYIDHVEGGDTHTECHGDPLKPVWEAGHQECRTWTNPFRTVTEIKQIDEIKVPLGNRNMKTTGGELVGRLNNGGVCPSGKTRIDGLCYNACPDGYEHIPGMPYNCAKAGEPETYGRSAGTLPSCGGKENIAGLCYGNVPSGYTRKVLGTLDQDCPAGSRDFGVGCVRESTTREGTLKLVSELRRLAD